VGVDAEGDFVVAWAGPGTGDTSGVFQQRFDDPADDAGPIVTDVVIGGDAVTPAERLVQAVPSLIVRFSENLGVGNAFSLTRNGVAVPINPVSFGLSGTSGKLEATVTPATPLADGSYVLTVSPILRDLAGNALDGNADGSPGGTFSRAFTIAQPVKIGPEFPVGPFRTDEQNGPNVASDRDGNYVIAWSSRGQDGSDFGVRAQRYAANGTPVGPEQAVNQFTTDRQIGADVAMDASGNYVVVWESFKQVGLTYEIYARRYTPAGPAGNEFRVSLTPNITKRNPAVAMDSAGDFVIAWESQSQDGSAYGVYAQRYNPAGAPQGGEFRVNTFTTGQQLAPAVAADADGDFVIAWQSAAQDGSAEGIFAQRFDRNGAPVGAEFPVNTFTPGRQGGPVVARDADGDFVIAWSSQEAGGSQSDVHAQRFSAAGTPVGTEFLVNVTTNSHQGASGVAMDADGDFVITWSTFGDLMARRYNAAGVAQTGEFAVNSNKTAFTHNGGDVAMDPDGDFVITWQTRQTAGGDYDVYSQRYAANQAPTTTGFAPVTVPQGSPSTVLNLWTAFDDTTDPDNALSFSFANVTNGGLFSLLINGGTGTLTIGYASGQTGRGSVTIRATDTGGLFTDAVINVTVTPTTPFQSTGSDFVFQTPPHRLKVTFNRDVDPATLQPEDLFVLPILPGGAAFTAKAVTYDAATRTATFTLVAAPQQFLADGYYRPSLVSGSVADTFGNTVGASPLPDFFVLAGDIDRNRAVNGTDFAILAGNFGKTGILYAGGDLNGDGAVNGSDFAILAGNFGKALPAPPPGSALSAGQPAGQPALRTVTRARPAKNIRRHALPGRRQPPSARGQ
jgi:hypothetical protein